MYSDTIPHNQHPYFTNKDEFPNPFMIVNAFSFKDVLVGMHAQEFTEINIVMGGSGVHYIKNKRLPAKCGDVFFILPEYMHGYMGDKDFEVYNVTIHKRFFDKYLIDLQALPAFSILFHIEPLLRPSNTTPLHLTLTDRQLHSLDFLLQEINRYSGSDTYADALVCNNLVVALIAQLCTYYTEDPGTVDRGKQNRDEAFLNALSIIHENYRDNITVDHLAEIAHLSRSTLVRRFHEVCNMSPHKYLLKCRIEAATHYLENTDLPLMDIAEISGFYDTAHLTRLFKAETGLSPTSYRKQHMKLQNNTKM